MEILVKKVLRRGTIKSRCLLTTGEVVLLSPDVQVGDFFASSDTCCGCGLRPVTKGDTYPALSDWREFS